MGLGLRYRFSAVTSLALFLVFLFLPYLPEGTLYTFLYYASLIVFFVDALVKVLDVEPVRPYTSALFSFFFALDLLTFFKLFGDPFSMFFALLMLVDTALKVIPGEQQVLGIREGRYRHVVSAIVTLFIGLGLLFSLTLPYALNILLGLLVLFDAIIKLEYVNLL